MQQALQLTKAVEEHTTMLQDQSRRLRSLLSDIPHSTDLRANGVAADFDAGPKGNGEMVIIPQKANIFAKANALSNAKVAAARFADLRVKKLNASFSHSKPIVAMGKSSEKYESTKSLQRSQPDPPRGTQTKTWSRRAAGQADRSC